MGKIRIFAVFAVICLLIAGCAKTGPSAEPASTETPFTQETPDPDNARPTASDDEESMQEAYAAADSGLTDYGTPDYSGIPTEELLKIAAEPYTDADGLTVLERDGMDDYFRSQEEAAAWTGDAEGGEGWNSFDVSVYENEGTLEYPVAEGTENIGTAAETDVPEELECLIPFGMRDGDSYIEDETTRMVMLPGREKKDFDEALRLADAAGYSGESYSFNGMSVYEGNNGKYTLSIVLNASSLMISIEQF